MLKVRWGTTDLERVTSTLPDRWDCRPLLADEDDLTVVFQPIVDLASATVAGYEALSRFPGTAAPHRRFPHGPRGGVRRARGGRPGCRAGGPGPAPGPRRAAGPAAQHLPERQRQPAPAVH